MQAKISIILVNYNQREVTIECLNSLGRLEHENIEIFLVDNASDDANRVDPKSFPNITFIQSGKNLGFAGGNNLAIKRAKGEYILLLNNDTEVTPGFLKPLLETFSRYPDAGIVSPKIIFFNSENLIQYAGTTAINPYTCSGKTIGYKEKDAGQYDYIAKTNLAHGACMLIHRKVIEKIGILHENYFLYYEEYDYCEMAKRHGFSIYFNGLSYILHKESVSVGKFSSLKSYYMAKNRVLFALRNFNGWRRSVSIVYYFVIALPKNILSEILAGRPKNSGAMVKGAFSNF